MIPRLGEETRQSRMSCVDLLWGMSHYTEEIFLVSSVLFHIFTLSLEMLIYKNRIFNLEGN